HRRGEARRRARNAAGQRGSDRDRGSTRRDCARDRSCGCRRRGAHRRQGPREVPGDRRPHDAVRGRGGGARGAGGAAREVACRVSAVRLTVGWVAAAVAGRIVSGDAEQVIGNVITDSRSLQAGDLFVAIRGPRFDGHAFVEEAVARGAIGAIVDAGSATHQAPSRIVIEVGDTVQALQDLAHAVREASGSTVIAITGSAGKTTTKETIADFLSAKYRVVKNKGNLNNHIGLPLSLMQLRDGPDVAVM